MSDVGQMMRAANPVSDPAAAISDGELDALLLLTQTRSGSMSIDQLEKPTEHDRTKARRKPWFVAAAAFAVVLVVGIGLAILANLGNSGGDVVDPEPPTTTTPELLGPDARPATPVSAVLGSEPDQAYFARSSDDFDPAVMGVEPGSVTAEWFRAEGFFVVFFDGVDKAATGGLCPSAFIGNDTGDDHMANAPTEGADCSSIVINALPDPDVRTLECGDSLAYRTAIPDDQVGVLIAALEKPVGDGIMGILSVADSQAGDIPEVDISIFGC